MTEPEGKKCPYCNGIHKTITCPDMMLDTFADSDEEWAALAEVVDEALASQKSELKAKVLELTLRHISHKCDCWRIHECASVINVEIQDLDKKCIEAI